MKCWKRWAFWGPRNHEFMPVKEWGNIMIWKCTKCGEQGHPL